MEASVLAVSDDEDLLRYLNNAAYENSRIRKGWDFT
mgnify:CR=1 FL=1